jgi:hypothetical protein
MRRLYMWSTIFSCVEEILRDIVEVCFPDNVLWLLEKKVVLIFTDFGGQGCP